MHDLDHLLRHARAHAHGRRCAKNLQVRACFCLTPVLATGNDKIRKAWSKRKLLARLAAVPSLLLQLPYRRHLRRLTFSRAGWSAVRGACASDGAASERHAALRTGIDQPCRELDGHAHWRPELSHENRLRFILAASLQDSEDCHGCGAGQVPSGELVESASDPWDAFSAPNLTETAPSLGVKSLCSPVWKMTERPVGTRRQPCCFLLSSCAPRSPRPADAQSVHSQPRKPPFSPYDAAAVGRSLLTRFFFSWSK